MTTFTEHKHGTFSWIELATKDAEAAKRFYGGLFGWTFEDMPAGPGMIYSMAKLDGKVLGALYQMNTKPEGQMATSGPAQGAMPSHWASYVTVDDVDARTKKVAAAGGKVMKDAFDVMDVGRMSVVQDAGGGTLCLWTAKKHIGAHVKDVPGTLCWVELYSNNVDRDGKFYVDLFGWKTDAHDMGPMGTYTLFKTDADPKSGVGGMMAMPPNLKGAPNFWLAYLATDDVDASTKKVKDLGGKVKMEPMDIPNIGRFSVVEDPTGAAFALYKNAH
jgi:predicted enzyme related to lactoylglutathione lyase